MIFEESLIRAVMRWSQALIVFSFLHDVAAPTNNQARRTRNSSKPLTTHHHRRRGASMNEMLMHLACSFWWHDVVSDFPRFASCWMDTKIWILARKRKKKKTMGQFREGIGTSLRVKSSTIRTGVTYARRCQICQGRRT